MFTRFTKIAASFSLMLGATVAVPASSVGKEQDRGNCPYAKAKLEQAKRVVVNPPARGVMLVEHRKRDVQILSFGP